MREKHQILQQYEKSVENLLISAKKSSLKSSEVLKVFNRCFLKLAIENEESSRVSKENSRLHTFCIYSIKILTLALILAIIIYIILNVHQPTASLVLRNVQGLIYPGLRLVRYLSVPIIKKFPSLTHLYDESCLLENPYFYIDDMECWPCQNVFSVVSLTGILNQTMYLSGIPHLTKTSHASVPYNILKNFYERNQIVLDNKSSSIKSNSYKVRELKDVFSENFDNLGDSIHVAWRINKMELANIIRSIFPKPESLPERTGQSVERFIMIDGAKSPPYHLPNTECSYVSVRQAIGSRILFLKPSPECHQDCGTVSVELKTSMILWYNWWYWRPVSLPTENSTGLSISYISSYC